MVGLFVFSKLGKNKITVKKERKAVLFTHTFVIQDIHRGKDVGIIIENLKKDFGWETYIFTINNVSESVSEKFNSHIIKLSSKYWGFVKNIVKIRPNLLIMFHLTGQTLLFAVISKIFNPYGKIWVKADVDFNNYHYAKYYTEAKGFSYVYILAMKVLTLFAFVSCENRLDYERNKKAELKLFHSPNGMDIGSIPLDMKKIKKENLFLTVGRLGTYQKNTQEFLEIAKEVLSKFPSYKAVLIGSIADETGFEKYLDIFMKENEVLRERIIFTGPISQKELFEWYKKARFLVMSSRYEGFSNVFAEAGYFGDIIIARDVGGVRDITNDGEFGLIYNTIQEIPIFITKQAIDIQAYRNYLLKNYTYDVIIYNLLLKIGLAKTLQKR